MIRYRMMVLGTALALLTGAQRADAQAVLVDIGINAPPVGARIIWGSPPPVVVYHPAPEYHYYPAPVRVVYYQSLPFGYWEYVRFHDPYRYARFRAWLDYERDYDRAWRMHDRARYDALRAREHRYFRERAEAERWYRSWRLEQVDERGRGRGHGRGRGR